MRRKLIAALGQLMEGGVSGRSAEVCGCRAADVGTLLEGFACEEVTIKVANKGQGVMVKEDLVTHRSIKEDLAFPAYQRPQLQTYQPVGSVSLAFFAHFCALHHLGHHLLRILLHLPIPRGSRQTDPKGSKI